MIEPVPTPTFDDDESLTAFQALFNPPPYDPDTALAKAKAVFPEGFNPDSHWLAFALILANSGLEWMFRYMNWQERVVDDKKIEAYYGQLSGGEYVLTALAMHLLNDVHRLPDDSLLCLRRLSDRTYELALHAIHIHTRGANAFFPNWGKPAEPDEPEPKPLPAGQIIVTWEEEFGLPVDTLLKNLQDLAGYDLHCNIAPYDKEFSLVWSRDTLNSDIAKMIRLEILREAVGRAHAGSKELEDEDL
jgi:hypothetical protein